MTVATALIALAGYVLILCGVLLFFRAASIREPGHDARGDVSEAGGAVHSHHISQDGARNHD